MNNKRNTFYVMPNVPFARSHGYRYIGHGWFVYDFPATVTAAQQTLNVAVPPVKYNGCFLDLKPQ